MIVRVWRGETLAARADDYYRYLVDTGAAECAGVAGNAGVHIWRRDAGEIAEFVFVSYWRSMEAVRLFAGEDVERARYYPIDHEFLLSIDAHVRHYELALDQEPRALDAPHGLMPPEAAVVPGRTQAPRG